MEKKTNLYISSRSHTVTHTSKTAKMIKGDKRQCSAE